MKGSLFVEWQAWQMYAHKESRDESNEREVMPGQLLALEASWIFRGPEFGIRWHRRCAFDRRAINVTYNVNLSD
jgi:hypothetical protein